MGPKLAGFEFMVQLMHQLRRDAIRAKRPPTMTIARHHPVPLCRQFTTTPQSGGKPCLPIGLNKAVQKAAGRAHSVQTAGRGCTPWTCVQLAAGGSTHADLATRAAKLQQPGQS